MGEKSSKIIFTDNEFYVKVDTEEKPDTNQEQQQ